MKQNAPTHASGTELEPPDFLAIGTERLDELIEAGVPDAGGGYDDTGIHAVEFNADGLPPEACPENPSEAPYALDMPPWLGLESWDAFLDCLENNTDFEM